LYDSDSDVDSHQCGITTPILFLLL